MTGLSTSSMSSILEGMPTDNTKILIPLAMIMGWYTVSAEPAVLLNKQVEDISAGKVSSKLWESPCP